MQPQMSWINESARVDKIIKFESIENEWRELQEEHNLPDLKHINKSTHRHWPKELDNESIKVLGELYADDFEHLGYERL